MFSKGISFITHLQNDFLKISVQINKTNYKTHSIIYDNTNYHY